MYNQFFTIKPRISEKKRWKQSCTPNKKSKEIKENYIENLVIGVREEENKK